MNSEEAVRAAIDSEPFFSLRVWADIIEEKGEKELAGKLRWLADNRRIPWYSRSDNLYLWEFGGDSLKAPYMLPVLTWEGYYSRSEAYLGAAKKLLEMNKP